MLNKKSQYLKQVYSIALAVIFYIGATAAADSNAPANSFTPEFSGSTQSSGSTIGSLPSSNQWLYDRTSAFIYLGYSSLDLNSQTLSIAHYKSDLGTTSFKYISADSFMRLFSLASPEGPSFFGKFAIWSEFSVGFGQKEGDLYDTDIKATLPAESSSLGILFGKIGLQLVFDYPTWIKPYVGISNSWYGFRNTSSMSGAVTQGGGDYYGPVVGLHLPLNFLGRMSIYGELQKVIVPSGGRQIFASGSNFNGGAGFSF